MNGHGANTSELAELYLHLRHQLRIPNQHNPERPRGAIAAHKLNGTTKLRMWD